MAFALAGCSSDGEPAEAAEGTDIVLSKDDDTTSSTRKQSTSTSSDRDITPGAAKSTDSSSTTSSSTPSAGASTSAAVISTTTTTPATTTTTTVPTTTTAVPVTTAVVTTTSTTAAPVDTTADEAALTAVFNTVTNLDIPFADKKRYIAPAPGKNVDDLQPAHDQFRTLAKLALAEFAIKDIMVTGDTAVVDFTVGSASTGFADLSSTAVRNHDEKVWQINQEALCDAAALVNVPCP